MTSSHRQHTGHELSRSRAHEGERAQQDHDKGGHQAGHDKPPGPVDLQKALEGVDYPAVKSDLVRCARDAHAAGQLVEGLLRIPDREYASPASVAKELAKLM
ncbi:DUF2795 domain-containing protein [Burkholderia gladioli]|uniref:DUF2795 domain-containing protein n=1 Tax=Burkholderia gladioli TaxID=28095 RepID=UPI00164015E3|nr:DUF2795 domain-containing protein [Burkholderia gladioli]